MVTFYPDLSKHESFILAQKIFFVATAPLTGNHVNVSPKGHDGFRVLTPNRVAYLDLTGSGIETISHLRENGRITFMFCAYDGPPKIVRLWGTGEALIVGTPEFEAMIGLWENSDMNGNQGIRSIIVADIFKVGQSCGFGVPLYDFKEQRQTLLKYWKSEDETKLAAYFDEKNMWSLDGLPGLAKLSATQRVLKNKELKWIGAVGIAAGVGYVVGRYMK